MKKLLVGFIFIMAFNIGLADSPPQVITTGVTQLQQQAITPEQVLNKLKAGNQRFTENKMNHNDFSQIRKNTASGQYPYAFVLSCIDSRSSPDLVLDQGLGNIFVGRVAGNIVNKNMLGSMEFATKHSGAKLIVVMGHTDCGAIKGACEKGGENNLKTLLRGIYPAVKTVSSNKKINCQNKADINAIAKQNIIDQVDNIYQDSNTIKQLVNENKVMLVGAMHNLTTGKVDFFYIFKKPSN